MLLESEYETLPEHLIQPKWVWLDYWNLEENIEEATPFVNEHGSTRIVVVSPELHGPDPLNVWKQIFEEIKQTENLYICTDYPGEFSESFD